MGHCDFPGAPPRGQPIGTELLDDPHADPDAVVAQLGDIARLNRWFGGTRAVVKAVEPLFTHPCSPRETGNRQRLWTLLDVGTGAGDIPLALVQAAARYRIRLVPIGLELNPAAARLARRSGVRAVVGDGGAPPFAPKSVDIVVASQVLHHLPWSVAARWIATFDGLARRAVVLADLRPSWLAIAALRLAGGPLGMSRTTRRDAALSLRRGFTAAELRDLLAEAGVRARVARRRWARIVAVWEPCAPSTA